MVHAQDAVDLIVSRFWRFVDEVFGAHDDTRSAKPALESSARDEAGCEHIAFAFAETFKRLDPLPGGGSGRHCAGNYCAIVDDYGAASALPLGGASIFRRDQSALIAENLEQGSIRF
jgi:hypothetical protein